MEYIAPKLVVYSAEDLSDLEVVADSTTTVIIVTHICKRK